MKKLGNLNPMFNKGKSPEFIEQMNKNKSGKNNPMFGKTHSEVTLNKLRKKLYVYDAETMLLIKEYNGIVKAKKSLRIGYDTLLKYAKNKKYLKIKFLV